MRLLIAVILLCASALLVVSSGCSGKKQKRIAINGDTLSRIEILNENLRKDPDNPGLLYERAQYYYENKMAEKGLEDINKALGIDSSKAEYHLLQADFYYATNKIQEARSGIEIALRLDPKNKDANIKMGELQFYLREYSQAFKYLDDALRLDPYDGRIYFLKGMCFKETGNMELALSSFQTAVEQDPDHFHAYMQLATIYAEQGNPIAIDYYNNAIRINPAMIEAHYGLAFFLQQHGNADGAIKVYNDLLSVEPNHAPSMHNIGFIFLFMKDDARASITWFTKSLSIDPTYPEAWYHRGRAHQDIGDIQAARVDYEKALELDPEFTLPLEYLRKMRTM